MSVHATFTKHRIDAMKPGDQIWDGGGKESVTGLVIRCREGGTRTFGLKYRVGGRQRWLTLGKFGSPLTVATARKLAKKMLGEVAHGRDPAEGILAEKRAMTVEALCKQYQEAIKTTPTKRGRLKTAGTLAIEAGHIARHIVPVLGRLKVPSVSRRDIERYRDQVAAGATKAVVKTKSRGKAVVSGGHGTAARSLNTLSSIFQHAVNLGLRSDNPVRGVVRAKGNSVKTFLNPDEMKALGTALAAKEMEQPQAVAIIRLLALTGARRNEIAHLRWPWVDLYHGALRLPQSKTGERLIVLGKAAQDLLAGLPRHAGTDLVFPPTKAGGLYQNTAKVWRKVRETAKISARLHDLRHHFASLAGELGYQLPTISGLLGHSIPGTTGRYLHHTDKALKEAADRIASVVGARLTGTSAEVADLARARAERTGETAALG